MSLRAATLSEVAHERKSPSELVAQMEEDNQKTQSDVFERAKAAAVKDVLASLRRVRETEKAKANSVTTSRIRVQLSRALTWAEKEALETNWDDANARRINESPDTGRFKLHVAQNREHVWAEAGFGSRILFELIAMALEDHFVNVYPKAVRTFREYNGR